jgi:hypothetical protein
VLLADTGISRTGSLDLEQEGVDDASVAAEGLQLLAALGLVYKPMHPSTIDQGVGMGPGTTLDEATPQISFQKLSQGQVQLNDMFFGLIFETPTGQIKPSGKGRIQC